MLTWTEMLPDFSVLWMDTVVPKWLQQLEQKVKQQHIVVVRQY